MLLETLQSDWIPVLQRVNLKDYLAIYTEGTPDDSCQRCRISTSDADDFAWSPDGAFIAVCDSPLHHSVFVHKAADGSCVKRFQLSGKGLGVRAVQWSPSSQFLAIGSYDNVRPRTPTLPPVFLNAVAWRLEATRHVTDRIQAGTAGSGLPVVRSCMTALQACKLFWDALRKRCPGVQHVACEGYCAQVVCCVLGAPHRCVADCAMEWCRW